MHNTISRRNLIKLAGAVGLAGVATGITAPRLAFGAGAVGNRIEPQIQKPRRPFARVMSTGVIIRALPDIAAKQVRVAKWNEVIEVVGQTESDASPVRHNKIWYQTKDGFAHSQFLQPVENTPQTPESSVPTDGFWAETFVANTVGRSTPDPIGGSLFRMPFSTVFRVLEIVEGADKEPWYRISDGRSDKIFAKASFLRKMKLDEFAPISPGVAPEDKRIDVDIKNQLTVAYEKDVEVWRARTATGARFTLDDGTLQDFTTTPGKYRIYEKRPSRRMSGGAPGTGDFFDLPGIPWVSYFSRSRMAFHGAYWHNDFGRPRSHGCVNLLPEDANWVYRWTLPAAVSGEPVVNAASRDAGTVINVF